MVKNEYGERLESEVQEPTELPDTPFLSLTLNQTQFDGLVDLLRRGVDVEERGISFVVYSSLTSEAQQSYVAYHGALKETYQNILKNLLDLYDGGKKGAWHINRRIKEVEKSIGER